MTIYKGIINDPIFQELNILFKNFNSNFEPFSNATKIAYPMDVWFNDEYLAFEIPILNGKKEDISVTKTSDNLRIKYTRSNKSDEPNSNTYIRRGIVRRDFDFTWKITSKFDSNGIQSVYENGVLTVYIPFAKEAKPEEVPVLDTNENWKKLALGQPIE